MYKNLFRITLLGTAMAMILAACALSTPTQAPDTVQPTVRVAEQPTATLAEQPPALCCRGPAALLPFVEATHTFTGSFVSQADGSGRVRSPPARTRGRRALVVVWQADRSDDGAARRTDRHGDHRPGRDRAAASWRSRMLRSTCHARSGHAMKPAWHARHGTTPIPPVTGSTRCTPPTAKTCNGLTTPPAGMHDLPGDFSPDGQLVFKRHTGDEGPGALMLVALSGGEPRLLYDKQMMEDPGRFSPDGRSVATSTNGRLVSRQPGRQGPIRDR